MCHSWVAQHCCVPVPLFHASRFALFPWFVPVLRSHALFQCFCHILLQSRFVPWPQVMLVMPLSLIFISASLVAGIPWFAHEFIGFPRTYFIYVLMTPWLCRGFHHKPKGFVQHQRISLFDVAFELLHGVPCGRFRKATTFGGGEYGRA